MSQTVPFDESVVKGQHDTIDTAAEDGGITIAKHKHEKSRMEDKYIEVSQTLENTSIEKTLDPDSKLGLSLATRKEVAKSKNMDVLAVISIQFVILALMILLTMQYSWLHNVPHILSPLFGNQDVSSFADAIANYNFVGMSSKTDEPSIFAVVLEVAIWSLAGVLARSEYYLSQIVVKKKQFFLLETTSKLISDGAMGIAIAIAVVLFLRATEFLNISLRNADVASIAAISFILGFYHEDTRRLLGSFRKKLSESREES